MNENAEEARGPIDAGGLSDDLGRWLDAARASLGGLAALRERVEESSRKLESPAAVLEFIDFFSGFFTQAVATIERVQSELAAGAQIAHGEALRQIASNASVEQRRGLKFRDKWINRPLPFEDVRPLLTEISQHVGNRIASCRELTIIAGELEALAGPPPPAADGRALDRRALFTKWFGKTD